MCVETLVPDQTIDFYHPLHLFCLINNLMFISNEFGIQLHIEITAALCEYIITFTYLGLSTVQQNNSPAYFRTAHGYSQSAKRRKGAKFDDLNGVDGQTGGEGKGLGPDTPNMMKVGHRTCF